MLNLVKGANEPSFPAVSQGHTVDVEVGGLKCEPECDLEGRSV